MSQPAVALRRRFPMLGSWRNDDDCNFDVSSSCESLGSECDDTHAACDAIWNPFATLAQKREPHLFHTKWFVCCKWNRAVQSDAGDRYRSPWTNQVQPKMPPPSDDASEAAHPAGEATLSNRDPDALATSASLSLSTTSVAASVMQARRHRATRHLEYILNAVLRIWCQTWTPTDRLASENGHKMMAVCSAFVAPDSRQMVPSVEGDRHVSFLNVHVVTSIQSTHRDETVRSVASSSPRARLGSPFDWEADASELPCQHGVATMFPALSFHHHLELDLKQDADLMKIHHHFDGRVAHQNCLNTYGEVGSVGWNCRESRRHDGLTYQHRAAVIQFADSNRAVDALVVMSPAVVAQHIVSCVQQMEHHVLHHINDALVPRALLCAGPIGPSAPGVVDHREVMSQVNEQRHNMSTSLEA